MLSTSLLIIALLFTFSILIYLINKLEKVVEQTDDEESKTTTLLPTLNLKERLMGVNAFLILGAVLAFIALLAVVYVGVVNGSFYESHIFEWLNLLVRWFHITIGIAWIGASFYFVFLENSLNRTKGLRDELAGNLWAVHGGGFYYVEKYKLAPQEIPKDLHWFKYEAYFTWISGFTLLCIVYYFNAKGMLIDPTLCDISPAVGIGIGIGSLAVSWIVYDLMCKSALAKQPILFAMVGFALATGLAYFLMQIFNSRAAYIHIGAMLGTLMAGNVFWGIIPAQTAMVKAAKEGKPLDPALGKNAGLRSLHNNYMTLPVLFIMISNHFPSTFGNDYNWAVLAGISLSSAVFKHYLNLKERGQQASWIVPIAAVMMIGVAFATAPVSNLDACEEEVSFTDVYNIMSVRCLSCHSSQPTDDVNKVAPNGVKYDTPEEIVKMKDKIMQRTVMTKSMPQNNKTGMTPEERALIGCWIEQGAKVE